MATKNKYEYYGMFEHPPEDFRLNSNDIILYIRNFKIERLHFYNTKPEVDYKTDAHIKIRQWLKLIGLNQWGLGYSEPIFKILRYLEFTPYQRKKIASYYRESVLNKLTTAIKELSDSTKKLRNSKVNISEIFILEDKLKRYKFKREYFYNRRASEYFFLPDIAKPLINILQTKGLKNSEIVKAFDKLFRIFDFDGYNRRFHDSSTDYLDPILPTDDYNRIKKVIF